MSSERQYIGVGKNLVAFACQYSFDKGLDGYVHLTSKTSKYQFYIDLGGKKTHGQGFALRTAAASNLVQTYLPGGVIWWQK